MAQIAAKTYQKDLKQIKENVTAADRYFRDNAKRYHDFMRWIYQSSINGNDKQYLSRFNVPQLEFNIIESYVNRAVGEFSDNTPSVTVHPYYGQIDPKIIDLYSDYLRALVSKADKQLVPQQIFKEAVSGGYSVMKVCYDYESPRSFTQEIYLKKVEDPTLCGFDILAHEPHKADAEYCYELFTKSEEDVAATYNINLDKVKFFNKKNEFNWYYITNDQKKIVLLCDYYKKKYRNIKIHLLADGTVITDDDYKNLLEKWNHLTQPPVIISTRSDKQTTICRETFIGDYVLDYEETIYSSLPLIFVDGNSSYIQQENSTRIQQVTRPMVYNLIDAQRLKNFTMSAYVNAMSTTYDAKFMADERSISEQNKENWVEPKNSAILLYTGVDINTGEPIPPPQPVIQPPLPQQFIDTFNNIDMSAQNMMGTYNNGMDINNNQLSGVAMITSAMQAGGALKPYINNYLVSLNQALKVVTEIMPNVLTGPQSVAVMDKNGNSKHIQVNTNQNNKINLGNSQVRVCVEGGSNYKIQQKDSLATLANLAQAFPGLAQFINTVGLPTLLKNVDLNGIEDLKQEFDQYQMQQQQMQQQQQQMAQQQAQMAAQNNPQMIAAQTQQQKVQMQYQIDSQKLVNDQKELQLKQAELEIKQEETIIKKLMALIKASEVQSDVEIEATKARAETIGKAADLAMTRMNSDRDHEFKIKQHEDNKLNKQQPTGDING